MSESVRAPDFKSRQQRWLFSESISAGLRVAVHMKEGSFIYYRDGNDLRREPMPEPKIPYQVYIDELVGSELETPPSQVNAPDEPPR